MGYQCCAFILAALGLTKGFTLPFTTTFKTRARTSISAARKIHYRPFTTVSKTKRRTHLKMAFDGGVGELTSALATLDQQYQVSSRKSKRPSAVAGWTKLILEPTEENEQQQGDSGKNEVLEQSQMNFKEEEFVYLLEPPSTPSLVPLFLGGAGLGQFPHIAYSELLSRISKRLNAAIITAPYPLSLDHFDLSKKSGEALRRALVQCEEKGGYSPYLPKFYLGHSLGSKLLAIQLAASGVRDVQGIGFMSFNNFGFSDTITMVKDFTDDLEKNGSGFGGGKGPGMQGVNLDQILDFAGQAAGMMGFEFDPNPETMNRIVEKKYDEQLQRKTKLFVFDNDDLDSSPGFIDACKTAGTSGPNVVKLDGKHLSPVYLKLGIDDLNVPDEAREFVGDAAGGFKSASFGDEDKMNGAVNAICDWIMGKEPPALSGGQD